MPGRDVNGNLFRLGRGKCYFNRKRTDGTYVGFAFLGNTPDVQVTPAQEVIEARSAADPTSAVVASDVISQDFELSIKTNEFAEQNIELSLFGTSSDYTQTSGSLTALAIPNVTQGYSYDTGKRAITVTLVKNTGGTVTYTVTTDYIVDSELGTVYVVPGGAITSGGGLEVTGTYPAITAGARRQTFAGESTTIEGAFRFVENNKRGKNHAWDFWNVAIRSDEAIALISNDYSAAGLKANVLADPVNHPTNQYFRVLEIP